MLILGLSFGYHDAAAALVRDGRVVCAVQEERLSRVKNDARFPRHAIEFCLEREGLAAGDLDWVVYYEQPLLKFQRILGASLFRWPIAWKFLDDTVRSWLAEDKFEPLRRIADELGLPPGKVRATSHHLAHAASAFHCSPFSRALVVTLDGVGETETGSVSVGEGARLRRLASMGFPHSIGLVYSAFTAFLGFAVGEGEYKVMGMAGFGEPRFQAGVAGMFRLTADGFEVDQSWFEFRCPQDAAYSPRLTAWLGPARVPESPFDIDSADPEIRERSRHYADVAASLQAAVEAVILHVVRAGMARTGLKDVCLAGGVALNSVANGRLMRELGCRLFVQPAAGDAGGAIGAALHLHQGVLGLPAESGPFGSPYLGPEFSERDCLDALAEASVQAYTRFEGTAELVAAVSQRLAEGAVLGWFQGRTEWGPRALGNRSILANPALPDMKETVNLKIKFREPFRPFAPSVLAEHAASFFQVQGGAEPFGPEDYMISVCPVHPHQRDRVPAITHVDGTARVHLVRQPANPLYHALISAFHERTGIPMLLNTSFNGRGEPIVNSPQDAIHNFLWNEMDCLVLCNILVEKADLG